MVRVNKNGFIICEKNFFWAQGRLVFLDTLVHSNLPITHHTQIQPLSDLFILNILCASVFFPLFVF